MVSAAVTKTDELAAGSDAGRSALLVPALLDELNDAVLQLSVDGVVQYANKAACDLFGRDHWPEIVELLSCEPDEARSLLKNCSEQAAPNRVTWPTVVACGQMEPCEWRLRPLSDGGLMAVVSCVAGRREQWQAESREQGRLRRLVDSVGGMMWLADSDGRAQYCNRTWRNYVGQTRQETEPEDLESPLHETDLARVRRARDRALRDLKPYRVTYQLRRYDGIYRLVEEYGVPRYDIDTDQVELVGLCNDIQRQREVRRRLEEMLEQIRALYESALDAIVSIDTRQRIVAFNPAAERMFGWNAREVIGKPLSWLMPEYKRERYTEIVENLAGSTQLTYRIDGDGSIEAARANGETFPVEASVSIVDTSQGRRIFGIVRDISDRLRAEEQLRQSEERYELAVSATNDGIWDWDIETGAVNFSPRFAQRLGYAITDVEQMIDSFETLLHPEDRSHIRSQMRAHLKGYGPFDVECRILTRHAGFRWFRLRGLAKRNAEDRAVYMAGSLSDIHDQRMAEDALREEEKHLERLADKLQKLSHRLMEVQEQERRHLARELHDEIGQSLTASIINLQSLMSMDDPTPVINDLSQGLNQVLCQVRNLSLDLRPSMLDDLGLESAIKWLLERQGQTGRLHCSLKCDGLPEERLDQDLEVTCFRIVQEAVNNIIKHAKASHVWVAVRGTGSVIELEIQDDGCGFDAERRLQSATHGASFGLVGMRERAALVGGHCRIESSPGHGTSITARLPMDRDYYSRIQTEPEDF